MAAVVALRCALLFRSLVKVGPVLEILSIYTDVNTSMTVLKGLLAAQLGPNRHFRFFVPSK